MAKLTRSIDIEAPVEKVFDFAMDVGKLWTSWPEEVALRDVELKPDGVGSSARLFTHFLAIHMEGSVEYTEVIPNQRIVAKVHFFGEKPTWVFTFEPADGGTKLTAEGEWHVNLPGLGKPIEGMLVKEHEGGLESLLANVKSRVEAKAAEAA
ncbi:MAG: SRPBCC family protein [Acidimicrobiia bacterium]|nr:SRPBCC family protein [Acidimicrobiia bacterium]MDH3471118.1 SRPBCC family protein [Acidimicrobiia bacterium]MDH5616335.1 SRPBCC family protein [Acidimicrobiia bacterium]